MTMHIASHTASLVETSEQLPGNEGVGKRFTRLIFQSRIDEAGKDWHQAVLSDIEARLGGDPNFPCIFSKNAFQKQLLRFIFVDSVDISGIQSLAEGLIEYVELSKDWNGSLNTAYPLIVAFSLDAIKVDSVEEYHEFGWKVLQKLHEIDPLPWPAEVAKDPNFPGWSMCFNGMQIFCNMSHPAHRVRRSRNLGEHFAFIINPRERFDIVAGDTPAGRKARANIRARIGRYDGIPHSPQLAHYGAGGIEWQQYALTEDNNERSDRCPFVFDRQSSGSTRAQIHSSKRRAP